MKLKKLLTEIISERSLPKNKWVKLKGGDFKKFAEELFDMIKKTYDPIGGHPNYKSPSDINPSDASYWEIIDVDDDSEPDAVSIAKPKRAGIKYVGGATDGEKASKRAYIGHRLSRLKKRGNYIEASHKIADILASNGIPIVDDEDTVKKVLKKDITWHGDGYYSRKIGSKVFKKRLFGIPIVESVSERNKKAYGPVPPKNKWFRASDTDIDTYADDIINMIDATYSKIGGIGMSVKSSSDIKKLAPTWDLNDIDADDDMDVANATKPKSAGNKFVAGMSDGSPKAKEVLVKYLMTSLKKNGNYAELSGAPAHIAQKNGIPYIDDEDKVRKALKKDITWLGDGWYERSIKGRKLKKRLFGKPKV